MSEADRTDHGRRLAESLRRAAELAEQESNGDVRARPQTLPEENGGFVDGVKAKQHLDEICPNGTSPLGPFIPSPSRERVVAIGGEGAFAKFPPYWLDAFDRFKEEHVLALLTLARRQVRKDIVNSILRQYWLRLVAIASLAATLFQYGTEVFAWVEAHLPALRGLWQLLRTGGV